MFDPSSVGTLAALAMQAARVASTLGAPEVIVIGLMVLAVIFAMPKGEKPPAPVSDGGVAADRDLPPAREAGGPAGGGPTGGMG